MKRQLYGDDSSLAKISGLRQWLRDIGYAWLFLDGCEQRSALVMTCDRVLSKTISWHIYIYNCFWRALGVRARKILCDNI